MNYNHLCYGCFREKDDSSYPCPFCGYDTVSDHPYSALPAGSVLGGRYMTGKVLGMGGFGITYLGFDLTLEIKVAIKEYMPQGISARTQDKYTVTVISSKDKSGYDAGAERFLDEARILAKLQNLPNIISVQNYFRENNTAYFVMDYIEGMSLKSYLDSKGGRISFDEAVQLLLPVMKALDQVHKQNLLHRDISPDNIYITSDGQSKLLDFGAARFSSGDNKSMSVILKHGYAPEEQYRSHGNQGPWSDVYAFGATLYHCVTGALPPDSIERVHNDAVISPAQLGADIPVYASDALMKALSVRPESRFQNMNEFTFALTGSPDSLKNAGKTEQSSDHTVMPQHSDTVSDTQKNESMNLFSSFGQRLRSDVRFLILFICCILVVTAAIAIPAGIALSSKGDKDTFGKGGDIETLEQKKPTTTVSDTIESPPETLPPDPVPEPPPKPEYVLKKFDDLAFSIKIPDTWTEEFLFDGVTYTNEENTAMIEIAYAYQTMIAVYSIDDVAKSADEHLAYLLGDTDETIAYTNRSEEYIAIGSEKAYHLNVNISDETEQAVCDFYVLDSKNGFGCYIILSVCYTDEDFDQNHNIVSESVKSFAISGNVNITEILHYQSREKDIQLLYDTALVTAVNDTYYDNAVFLYVGDTNDMNTVGVFNVGSQYTQKGYFTDMEAGFAPGAFTADSDIYTVEINQYIYYAKDYYYYDDYGSLYYFTVCTVPIDGSLYVVTMETMEYALDDSITLLGTVMHTLQNVR